MTNKFNVPPGIGNATIEALMRNPAAAAPAVAPTAASPPATRRRIPMSVPRRRLEVDAIPGFVLYWFKDSNVNHALEAGYQFVESREVRIGQRNPANSADDSGNTDLGNHVSVIGNKEGENNRPERLVLMKIAEEFWKEDRRMLDDRNAAIINAVFGPDHYVYGADTANPDDQAQVYVKTADIKGHGRLLNKGLKKVTQTRQ